MRGWNRKNRERLNAEKRERYAKDPEFRKVQSESKKRKYAKNPKAHIKRVMARQTADHEKYLEYQRQYAARNSARNVQRVREWKKANPNAARESYQRNKAKYKEWGRAAAERIKADPVRLEKRRKKGREYMRSPRGRASHVAHEHNRRARKAGGQIKECNALIKQWRAEPTFECHHCRQIFETARLHVDHFIPLAKGGAHAPENLVRSCPPCNLRKSDRILMRG